MYLIITFIGFIISLLLYFLIPTLKNKRFIYCVLILGAASLMWSVDFIVKGIKDGWNTLFNNLLFDSLFGLATILLVVIIYLIYLFISNKKKK